MTEYKLNSLRNDVKSILVNDEESRKDDMYLLSKLIDSSNNVKLKEKDKKMVVKLCQHWYELGLPNINSVVRCRRYLQTQDKTIIDIEAEKKRAEEEAIYKAEFSSK